MNLSNKENPYLVCPSLMPQQIPRMHSNILSCTFGILALVTVTINSLTLYAYYKTDQLKIITNNFIFVMNFSDLCCGVFLMPLMAAKLVAKEENLCKLQISVQFLAGLFGYLSFFMLIIVAYDRYLFISKLTKYNSYMNRFRMKVTIAIAVTTSGILSAVVTLLVHFNLNVFYVHISLILCHGLGISSICILYSRLLKSVKSHSIKPTLVRRQVQIKIQVKGFNNHVDSLSKDKENDSPTKATSEAYGRNRSLAKIVYTLTITMFILCLPFNVIPPIWTYHEFESQQKPGVTVSTLANWTFVSLLSNASANALILIGSNKRVRLFLKRLLL